MEISLYRSDIQNLIKEIGNLRVVDPSAAIASCEKLLEYADKQRDDALIGYGHFTLGQIYYRQNDIPTFYFEMLKCLKPFAANREWRYLSEVYNMFGIMAQNRGNIALALDYYYKAYEYSVEYNLPEMKVKSQINLASLYTFTGNLDDALINVEESYKYISNHMNMEGYVECLNAAIVLKGKIYLAMEKIEEAWACKNEVEKKCLSFLTNADKLVYNCFVAKLSKVSGAIDECIVLIPQVIEGFTGAISIMDTFNDLYDFLSMLMEIGAQNEFLTLYEKVYNQVKITSVKNLEKRLIQLKLKFAKNTGNTEEYGMLSESFLELMDAMDTENALMVSAVTNLRNSFHKLKDENKELLRKNKFLLRKSETDPLTGMSNRYKLREFAESAMMRASSNGVALAVELLDVDYFKEYNDNYGHQAGDECLIFISKAILNLSQKHTGVFCSKYGGDEFVLIYEGYSEEEVFGLAKELKTAIHDGNLAHEFAPGDVKQITISQGIYWGRPDATDNIWQYMEEAEEMLNKVKQKSKNGIMVGKAKHHGKEALRDGKEPAIPIITEVKDEEYVAAPEDGED